MENETKGEPADPENSRENSGAVLVVVDLYPEGRLPALYPSPLEKSWNWVSIIAFIFIDAVNWAYS